MPKRTPLLATPSAECSIEPARDPGKGMLIDDAPDVQKWAEQTGLNSRRFEEPWVLVLDRRSRLLHARRVSCGGPGGTHVEPSDVVRMGSAPSSPGFVLVHHHPSGNPAPNKQDIETTREILELAQRNGVTMLDHVITSRSGWRSMKQLGIVPARQ